MTLFVFTTELLILLVLSNYRLADSELNKKEMSRLKWEICVPFLFTW